MSYVALRACRRVGVAASPVRGGGAERRNGPQTPRSRGEVSLPDWEGSLSVGAQSCLLDSFVSTSSSLTHHRRLRQPRSRNSQICGYNWKCANKSGHTSLAAPLETGRLPRARHCRRSRPDLTRSREAHKPTRTTARHRKRQREEGKRVTGRKS